MGVAPLLINEVFDPDVREGNIDVKYAFVSISFLHYMNYMLCLFVFINLLELAMF